MSFVVSPILRLTPHRYYGLLRLLTRLPPGLHLFGLYHSLRYLWTTDRIRSLLFHCLLSQHPVLYTPEGSSRLLFQVLHRFHGLRCSRSTRHPLVPFPGYISTLQDSLNVAGCCLASPPRGVTTLLHSQLPVCTGCLLRGHLIVTTTGLPPVSIQCLSEHTPNNQGNPWFLSDIVQCDIRIAGCLSLTFNRQCCLYSSQARCLAVTGQAFWSEKAQIKSGVRLWTCGQLSAKNATS